jgi:hypothetical protein
VLERRGEKGERGRGREGKINKEPSGLLNIEIYY